MRVTQCSGVGTGGGAGVAFAPPPNVIVCVFILYYG